MSTGCIIHENHVPDHREEGCVGSFADKLRFHVSETRALLRERLHSDSEVESNWDGIT